jgi:mRNA-degrading endonuclease RelE of RelBE toxin-antitoxin system
MEFIELPVFTKLATQFLTMEELIRVESGLIINPRKGDLIQGTHGARKVRARAEGKGKSGGFRIVYYYVDRKDRIWLLNLCSKREQEDLSAREKKALAQVVSEIKEIENA